MHIPEINRPWQKNVKQGVRHDPDPFYNTTTWKKLRKSFLESNPYCAACLAEGKRTPADMVDHITRIKAGGDRLNPSNFQSLCSSCHARKSAIESNERHKSI